jgi:uncharacterized protein YjbI with pentapeptide repeats
MTLNGVDFRYRHLAAIDFSNSVLRACLFTEAILAASFFNDVQARFCNFDHIDGRGMQMQKGHFAFCSFIESDFDDLPVGKGNKVLKTNFDGTKLTNCDLTKAKLSPKQLAPATLISCKK